MKNVSIEHVKEILATDPNESLQSYFKELLLSEKIDDDRAKGIAKKIAKEGPLNLSENQLHIVRDYILSDYYVESCDRCAMPIPWEEMMSAFEDELCSWCRHQEEKND